MLGKFLEILGSVKRRHSLGRRETSVRLWWHKGHLPKGPFSPGKWISVCSLEISANSRLQILPGSQQSFYILEKLCFFSGLHPSDLPHSAWMMCWLLSKKLPSPRAGDLLQQIFWAGSPHSPENNNLDSTKNNSRWKISSQKSPTFSPCPSCCNCKARIECCDLHGKIS